MQWIIDRYQSRPWCKLTPSLCLTGARASVKKINKCKKYSTIRVPFFAIYCTEYRVSNEIGVGVCVYIYICIWFVDRGQRTLYSPVTDVARVECQQCISYTSILIPTDVARSLIVRRSRAIRAGCLIVLVQKRTLYFINYAGYIIEIGCRRAYFRSQIIKGIQLIFSLTNFNEKTQLFILHMYQFWQIFFKIFKEKCNLSFAQKLYKKT